jgi:hydrogenase-4 component E
VAILLCALKVVFIPKALHRARRYVGADIEIRPFINTPMSVLLAGVLTLFAYAVSEPVVALTDLPTRSSIPLALAVVFVGLFIIVSRRSALTQIVGFLVMENGIALLAALATFGIPLIVELGVFLDLFLGFLVMQVFLYRIRETFATIDVDQLRNLKH